MAFADTQQASTSQSGVGTFLRLSTEYPTEVYLLDEAAYIRWIHWLPEALRFDRQRRGIGITCPGPTNCPVCIRNAQIKAEVGEAYRKHKDHRPGRKRYLTNVLNVTPVKACKCGAVYFKVGSDWPKDCTGADCKSSLEDIEPSRLNRVQVLEGGVRLFRQFNALENAVTDEADEPLPIQQFPVRLISSGEGRKRETVLVPITSTLGLPREELFVLPNGEEQDRIDIAELVKPFKAEQIVHLMEGGSIADLYEHEEEELAW